MLNVSYDLHLHSCLSPCGDDLMTPANIAGMAYIKQLDVIALTDHNSSKNCEPTIKHGEEYGLVVIPGMELTTLEEVHVVCLFEELRAAQEFNSYVSSKMIPFSNNEEVFGKQQILNDMDEIIGTEANLLINAVNISFDQVSGLMKEYGGVMIPAHIDKTSNSLISNLGFIPPDSDFACAELKDMKKLHELRSTNPYLDHCNIITNSDAHYLEHMNEAQNFLYVTERSRKGVLEALQREVQIKE